MLSDTSPTEATATVKFPHRSRRGVLLGLTAAQLVVVAATGLLLLAVLLTAGVTGALKLIPVWALISVAVFARHHGRSLADWSPIVLRYALRRARGQLLWLARPSTRPRREGLLHLPGTAASLRVVASPDRHVGAVHDPHQNGAMVPERTWSAVCLSTMYQRSMPSSRRSFVVASEAM